ncbi:Prophage PssSM-02 [Pseudomonas coronafaciens pv. oryzae]|nr:Prophage PssSM-02 [Pseudomonas coronafaciens pv. oryzae]
MNYRAELVRRIGIVNVEWLEGPHEPQKYTIEDLKALTGKYRALTKELKKGQAA